MGMTPVVLRAAVATAVESVLITERLWTIPTPSHVLLRLLDISLWRDRLRNMQQRECPDQFRKRNGPHTRLEEIPMQAKFNRPVCRRGMVVLSIQEPCLLK